MGRGYSNKDENYLKAGFDEIVNEFGYFYSIYNLASGDITKYESIFQKKVVEVYRTQQIQSRINKSEALYSRLKSGKL